MHNTHLQNKSFSNKWIQSLVTKTPALMSFLFPPQSKESPTLSITMICRMCPCVAYCLYRDSFLVITCTPPCVVCVSCPRLFPYVTHQQGRHVQHGWLIKGQTFVIGLCRSLSCFRRYCANIEWNGIKHVYIHSHLLMVLFSVALKSSQRPKLQLIACTFVCSQVITSLLFPIVDNKPLYNECIKKAN